MKINFLVPGFSKCGTTTLCSLLAGHPQIFMPGGNAKEPMFFILQDYERHWDAYRRLFATAGPQQLLGEGSTFYSAHQHEVEARDRMLAHNPDIKLIFIARDPLARIESSFREFHHSAHRFGVNTPYTLAEAITQLPALIEDSLFWTRLSCYRQRLPDQQLLVLLLEDLKRDPAAVLRRCFAFLGVDPGFVLPAVGTSLNEGDGKLYDSRLLRWLRNQAFSAPLISGVAHQRQDAIFKALGLRRPFHKEALASRADQAIIRDRLAGDAAAFLHHIQRDTTAWPVCFPSDADAVSRHAAPAGVNSSTAP